MPLVASGRRALLLNLLVALGMSVCLAGVCSAEDQAAESRARLLNDVKYLASDELEGRDIGTPGLDAAADYVRDQFAKAGLNVTSVNGGAFQTFRLTVGASLGAANTLILLGPDNQRLELKLKEDFIPLSFGGTGKVHVPLVFAGYGIDSADKKYNDFDGLDVKDKAVLILRRVPRQKSDGPFSGPHGGVSSEGDLTSKVSNAFSKGAAAVVFVNDPATGVKELDEAKQRMSEAAIAVANLNVEVEAAAKDHPDQVDKLRQKLSEAVGRYMQAKEAVAKGETDPLMKFGYGGDDSVRTLPLFQITKATADKLLKGTLKKSLAELEAEIDRELKPQSAALTGWTLDGETQIERQMTDVKNVIGVLPGSGTLAEETIVIGAHYDHIGRGAKNSLSPGGNEIHNGADDNASGTASLLELARLLTVNPPSPSRRIVFIAFTGEELGLYGSARYTREPVFPLDKTVVMLNMDMVGRLNENKLTIFGTGTSAVWADLIERLGKEQDFKVTSQPEGFGPSDHSSFYAKQIPVLHFFTGNHNDYHRPTDDWEKINVEGMQRVVEMIRKMTRELAVAPERPNYIAVAGKSVMGRDGNRPYFGSIPDFSSDQPGYSLGGVAPGSPAEKGGLKAGDRIVKLGSHKIENLSDFDIALRKFKAGDEIDVTVTRDKADVTVKVTLDKPK